MQKSILTILIGIWILIPHSAIAQTEPRPPWVIQLPNAPSYANYVYVYGWGSGATEKEAELEAYKNALFYAFNEGGLIGFEEQAKTFDDIFQMKNIDAQMLKSVLPNRRICQTIPIHISKARVRIYILLKVQKDKSKAINLNDNSFIECETYEFREAVEQYNQKIITSALKIRDSDEEPSKAFKGNKYIAMTLDAGYPWNSSSSIIGRFGGTFGIGFQFSLGLDIGGSLTYPDRSERQHSDYFSYNAALRLYPLKNIFFSLNYGTIGCKRTSEFNDSEGRFGVNGWRQGKGISIIGGYDFIPKKDGLFLLSMGFGMSYDMFLTKWNPVINLKVGWRLGILK